MILRQPLISILGISGCLFFCGGCTRYHNNQVVFTSQVPGSMPFLTKDEVARVNGQSLTLTEHFYIQSLPLENQSTITSEVAYWLGITALLLQQEAQSLGKILPFEAALSVSFYAKNLSPSRQIAALLPSALMTLYSSATPPTQSEILQRIEPLIQKAQIQKNPSLLLQRVQDT